jgi:hypothetical protein
MSDADWPGTVWDQRGQEVDLQYNAETISIVNHLSDGANGKQCPKCKASPMARTQLVWEEGTSRRQDGGTVLQNNMVRRAAPPGRPKRPDEQPPEAPGPTKRPYKAVATLAVISYLLGPLLLRSAGTELSIPPLALPLAVLLTAGLAMWWTHHKRQRAWQEALTANQSRFAEEMRRYEANLNASQRRFQQWKGSWFCRSCSTIVAEQRGEGSGPSSGSDPGGPVPPPRVTSIFPSGLIRRET